MKTLSLEKMEQTEGQGEGTTCYVAGAALSLATWALLSPFPLYGAAGYYLFGSTAKYCWNT